MTDTTIDTPSTTAVTVTDKERIDAVIADLKQQLVALDAEKVRREAEATVIRVVQQESALEGRVITITRSRGEVGRLDHLIVVETAWKTFLVGEDGSGGARKTLCDRLLAMPKRIYDPIEKGRQEAVIKSIKSIDHGLMTDEWSLNSLPLGILMKEAGYQEGPKIENQIYGKMPWYGSLPETDQRLKALQAQRADEQHRLNEALSSDDQCAAKDAERLKKDLEPRRHTRGDGSQYLRHRDGRIEEVTS